MTWTGHVKGIIAYSDQYGNVYQSDEVDRDYDAALGSNETRLGSNVYPVLAFDTTGVGYNNGAAVAYAGILNSTVIAMNQFGPNYATIFPQSITVGQSWTPYPLVIRMNQVTFVQHLTQFTSQGGNSYSDVIKLNVIYLDSTFDSTYGFYSQDIKYSANVDLYLAKGTGIVEADVNNYNYSNFSDYQGSIYGSGKSATGSVWRKN
jgi:hypothetical protein